MFQPSKVVSLQYILIVTTARKLNCLFVNNNIFLINVQEEQCLRLAVAAVMEGDKLRWDTVRVVVELD